MARLLVIDDEPNVLYSLTESLHSDELEVLSAPTAAQGLELARTARPDAVLLDVRLPDLSGLEVYDRLRQLDPRLPVVVMTAYSTTETAIEAMKRGAFDYLLKPVDLAQLREVLDRALELSRLARTPTAFDQAAPPAVGDTIVGRSRVMQEVYKDIGRVAPQDVTVLILGESGTGKELVARAIYQHSRRAARPFLAMNCAAIPETLLESELFGHEKGSFTGADHRRIGKFEQAHGGTIFLDEIGDMTPATQAKVLRLLQEQRFERVGGNETIATDVRVIAATNQDLPDMVSAGRFRQDLFYRLNVFSLHLPPLRDRTDDLPELAEYFVRRFAQELRFPAPVLSAETLDALRAHPWPGNVRELQSALKYALVQSRGGLLTPACLPQSVRALPTDPAASHEVQAPAGLDVLHMARQLLASGQPGIYYTVLAEVDRVLLREVLARVKGNQVAAAEVLGVSRNTLRSKMRLLGIAVSKELVPEPNHAAQ
jgi:two-component system nitrogen regulation response regulator GlnG